VIENEGVALHYSAWTSSSVDAEGKPQELGGITTDVLRKQADGSWLIAIDNAWGTSVLPTAQ
jgi:ketosteroid isomerase-like protein